MTKKIRDLMPALRNKNYFNYGGQGPLPNPSLSAIIRSWEKIQELGPFTNLVWPYVTNEIEKTREQLANICGVKKNRLCLTENVTSGFILPLWGLPDLESNHMLISDCEHPGIIAACKELANRKRMKIDILPLKQFNLGRDSQDKTDSNILEIINSRLNTNTKLVVISHLLWNTGQLLPIKRISSLLSQHTSNPYLLVDGAQSFGQLDIAEDASVADIYAFTGHKWACGPEGLGGVAISERILKDGQPTIIGWKSLKDEMIYDINKINIFHNDSRRFEIATSCVPLLAGLRSSLDLLEEEVITNKRQSNICIKSKFLWEKLQNIKGIKTILKGFPPSGLVSFYSEKGLEQKIIKYLGRQSFWIRSIPSPSCLRACIHITSNEEEISKLVELISQFTK